MDLSARNTFGMKVHCRLFVEITEEADLPGLDFEALPKPLFVLGGGSNLLFTGDWPGTILHVAVTGGSGTGVEGLVHPRVHPKNQQIFGDPVSRTGARSRQVVGDHAGNCGRGRSERSERSTDEASLAGDADVLLKIGAGVVFDDFCAWAAEEGLWGAENLSLIPGEVGASAVQNIGAYGVEAKDIIDTVRAWDLAERRFVDIPAGDCAYGYRASKFKTEWKGRFIITAVTFRLSRAPQPKLDYGGVRKALEARSIPMDPADGLSPKDIRETIIEIRRTKLPDPAETGSAGSFFKNPVISKEHFARIVEIARKDNGADYEVPHYEVGDEIKVPAAWMIEQCGFKGERLGGAQVYPKQPLVLVNASGNATPEDVMALRDRIIDRIKEKYGISLSCEVETV